MEKTAIIRFRVDPEEKEAIEVKASACRLSISAYLRKLAREHELRSEFDQEAVKQLKRIGRNLNQAVYFMHKGEFSEGVKRNFERCLTALRRSLGEEE